jgi:hypothetical protein
MAIWKVREFYPNDRPDVKFNAGQIESAKFNAPGDFRVEWIGMGQWMNRVRI